MHIGAIWFLEALFVALVEVRLCLRVEKVAPALIATLFIAAIWSSNYIWLPLNIQSGFVGGGYVFVGYLARKHRLLEREFSPIAVIICLIISIAAFAFGVNVSLVRAYCGPYFLGLPVSLASSYLWLAIAKVITERTRLPRKVLDYYGKNSLAVLSMHLVLLDVGFRHAFVMLGVPSEFNILSLLNFSSQLLICALFVIGTLRISFLRSIFFGSQKPSGSRPSVITRFAERNKNVFQVVLKTLAIALLLEVAVFNFPFWSSQLYGEEKTLDYNVSKGLEPFGSMYRVGHNAYVEFDAEGMHVDNIELQLKVASDEAASIRHGSGVVVPLHIAATDAGNKELFSLPTTQYCSGIPSTHYIRVHLSGGSEKMRICFEQVGQKIKVKALAINVSQPFAFSMARFLFLIACILVFYALRPSSKLYAIGFSEKPFATKAITLITVACAVFVVIGVSYIAGIHHPSNSDGVENTEKGGYILDYNHYNHLADSIIEGKAYLDLPVSETLKELPNPYDRDARMKALSETRESVYMDYAYYNEHYYCYFGVLPALTTFVPYKLATGRDLSTDDVVRLFCLLSIVSLSILTYCLYKRYYSGCSLGLFILALVSILLCQGVVGLAYVPTTYSIPILSALFFASLGLSFWVDSVNVGGSLVKWKLATGGILIALTLACRPLFVLTAFAAFAIFKQEIHEGRFFKPSKSSVVNALCVIAPFMLIAIPVMYYNYVRFGSVFDFGATYNLTGADMTNRGFHLSRLPGCLFEYILQPLNINLEYPFIHGINMLNNYQGFWFYEPYLGGFLAFAPICLALPVMWFKREELKGSGIWWICVVFLCIALVISGLDAQIASITYRYFGDFGWLLLIATWLAIWQSCKSYSAKRLGKSVWLAALVTLVALGLVVNGWSLLSDDRYSAMVDTFPALYYGIKSSLAFLF